MATAKIYDFNGPIMDIEPFWDFLRQSNPGLYEAYRIKGAKDIELKRKHKPDVMAIYMDAEANGRYPAVPIPGAYERLSLDLAMSAIPHIFTSTPRVTVARQLQETGFGELVLPEQIVSLDELVAEGGLAKDVTKEDSQVYGALMQMMHARGFDHLNTYVDDNLARVKAALAANQQYNDPAQRIQRLFHFDRNANVLQSEEGYRVTSRVILVD